MWTCEPHKTLFRTKFFRIRARAMRRPQRTARGRHKNIQKARSREQKPTDTIARRFSSDCRRFCGKWNANNKNATDKRQFLTVRERRRSTKNTWKGRATKTELTAQNAGNKGLRGWQWCGVFAGSFAVAFTKFGNACGFVAEADDLSFGGLTFLTLATSIGGC